MDDPKLTDEALDEAIDHALTKRERDPQLRIAAALEEIAIQLQSLNGHLESTIPKALTAVAVAASQR